MWGATAVLEIVREAKLGTSSRTSKVPLADFTGKIVRLKRGSNLSDGFSVYFSRDFHRIGEMQLKAFARPIILDWPISLFFCSSAAQNPFFFILKALLFKRDLSQIDRSGGVIGHIPHILTLRRGGIHRALRCFCI